jgi:hypothetical protein
LGSDIAIASHPFLTDIAPRRTTVLARDELEAVEVWRLLCGLDLLVDPRWLRWRVGD